MQTKAATISENGAEKAEFSAFIRASARAMRSWSLSALKFWSRALTAANLLPSMASSSPPKSSSFRHNKVNCRATALAVIDGGIIQQVADAGVFRSICRPRYAMNLITFFKQLFGEIRTVLPGDTRDERTGHGYEVTLTRPSR